MENLTIDEILKATSGELIVDSKCYNYKSVSIDSRKVEKEGIFFGIKGEKVNGSLFGVKASQMGATLVILEELPKDLSLYKEYTSVIMVKDGLQSLINLAKFYREKLHVKIIGITGSNGKTSTKDLVAAVLSSKYKVLKTEGNYNNHLGLPLTLFRLDNSYEVAVLELGMSNLGEINLLANICKPSIGVITNIGVSHLQNLLTRENILKAKLEITDFFHEDNTLIINGDNDLLKELKSDKYQIIKAGRDNNSNIFGKDIILGEEGVSFKVIENEKEEKSICVNALGEHSVTNSILAIAIGRKLGLTFEEISKGFESLEKTKMRLEVIEKEDFKIINDCYNASPDSMRAAIDVLISFKGRKILVLGTMLELGENSYQMHKEIGKYGKDRNVEMLLTTGEYKEAYLEGFGENSISFNSKEDIEKYIKKIKMPGDIILVKASRGKKFETIIEKL